MNRGDRVLDLGYYPGAWSQYASKTIGDRGFVVGVDLRSVEKNSKLQQLRNILMIQQDIRQISSLQEVEQQQPFDVILSDMAPKTTGAKIVDQLKSLELLEHVFKILPVFLRSGGHMVAKVFESQEAQSLLRDESGRFQSLYRLRPRSTRSASKEIYVIGKVFNA